MVAYNIFIIFYFVRKEHQNISPIHSFKTMCKVLIKSWVVQEALHTCNYLLNHVQPCTIKPWVFQEALHIVLKPCALPTFSLPIIQFFIFYYFVKKKHYNISPILCCFSHLHFLWKIIKFFYFYYYYFVRQEHYNISPILGCFCGRHLFWWIIKILFLLFCQ